MDWVFDRRGKVHARKHVAKQSSHDERDGEVDDASKIIKEGFRSASSDATKREEHDDGDEDDR